MTQATTAAPLSTAAPSTATPFPTAALDYLLHLADNALVLGQRNAEWCGHGPILEEDIALANVSLDLIGQARLLYQLAATVKGGDCTEDKLAYFRDSHEFRNYTLLELPHHAPLSGYAQASLDYGVTTVRNFLYDALMVLLWQALEQSSNASLAAIAAKSVKEARYHLRHARNWLLRLGDGTADSHRRTQDALDHLFPYTQEFWTPSTTEAPAIELGIAVDVATLQAQWDALVNDTLKQATLQRPTVAGYVSQGKSGIHSEHLGFLLAEMQSLARAHPEAQW